MAVFAYFYTLQLIDTNVFKFAVNLRYNLIWLFFSLSWIIVFEGLFYLSKNKHKLFVYNFLSLLWTVVFVVQICYCDELGKFMIFSDIFSAGEGLQYVKQVLLHLNLGMVLIATLNVVCTVAVNRLLHNDLKTKEDNRSKLAIFLLIVFAISFRLVAYISLGKANNNPNFENLWEENYNAKDDLEGIFSLFDLTEVDKPLYSTLLPYINGESWQSRYKEEEKKKDETQEDDIKTKLKNKIVPKLIDFEEE